MTVDSLEAAIALVNSCKYGNGTAIFTQSGAAARKYQHEVDVGQVGINVALVSLCDASLLTVAIVCAQVHVGNR